MLLESLFVHLRRGQPTRFLASRLLSFYGRLLIGGPKASDIPASAPKAVREHLASTYFDLPVDRLPRKRLDQWEIGSLWMAQLRDEEEKQVAKAAFLYSAVLCTLLVGAGSLLHKSTTGIETWWKQHKAESAAEEAAEYRAKAETMKKEWATEIAGYSAQKCIDEVSGLRIRKTSEALDRYTVLESGCSAKRDEILAIAKPWTIDQCADYGNEATSQAKSGGEFTWVDRLIVQDVCFPAHGEALRARVK